MLLSALTASHCMCFMQSMHAISTGIGAFVQRFACARRSLSTECIAQSALQLTALTQMQGYTHNEECAKDIHGCRSACAMVCESAFAATSHSEAVQSLLAEGCCKASPMLMQETVRFCFGRVSLPASPPSSHTCACVRACSRILPTFQLASSSPAFETSS